MPYDPTLDESLFSKSFETESDKVTVSIQSYNKGTKKLQISRENKNKQGEFKFAKLGRLTKVEVQSIIPLIQEASGHMD